MDDQHQLFLVDRGPIKVNSVIHEVLQIQPLEVWCQRTGFYSRDTKQRIKYGLEALTFACKNRQ